MQYSTVNVVNSFGLNGANIPFPSGVADGRVLGVSGNTFAYISPTASSNFSGTTSNVPEGSNLYYTDTRAVNAATGILQRSYINISGLNITGNATTPLQISNNALRVDNIGYLALTAPILGSRSGFMEVGTATNIYQGGRIGNAYVGTPKVNTNITSLYAGIGHYLQNDTGFSLFADFLGKTYVNTTSYTAFTINGLPSGLATGYAGIDVARVSNFGLVVASGAINAPNSHVVRIEQGLHNSGLLGLYTDSPNALEVRSRAGVLKAKIDSNGQPTFGNVNIPTTIGSSGQVLISNGSTVSFGSPVTQLRILVDENGGADFTSLTSALSYASGIASINKKVTVQLNSDIGISTPLNTTIDMTNPSFAYVNIEGKNHTIVSKATKALFKVSNGINISDVTLSWNQPGIDFASISALNSASGVAIECYPTIDGNSSPRMSNISIFNFGVGIKFLSLAGYDYINNIVSDYININNLVLYNNIVGISGIALQSSGLAKYVNITNLHIDNSVYAAYIQTEDTVGIISSGLSLNISNAQIDSKYGIRTHAGKFVGNNIITGASLGSISSFLQTYNNSFNMISNLTIGNDCTIVDSYDNSTTRFSVFGVTNTNPIFKQNNNAIIYAQLDNCTYNPTIANSGNVYVYGATPGGGFKVGTFTLPSSVGNSGLVMKTDGRGNAYWG